MAKLSYARLEPMFRDRSLNRTDIATDLAIPVLAEGGWAGLTLAAVAARGNMKRQSLTQWFGSGEAFREQVACCYTRRWLMLLSSQLTPLYRTEQVERTDLATVARLLLPEGEDGVAFARIWLAICEAGRTEGSVAAAASYGETEQLAMIGDWLPDADVSHVRAVSALVTGLRAHVCAADPISLADAQAATELLSRPETLRR